MQMHASSQNAPHFNNAHSLYLLDTRLFYCSRATALLVDVLGAEIASESPHPPSSLLSWVLSRLHHIISTLTKGYEADSPALANLVSPILL